MSTTTPADVRHDPEHALAVALGLVRRNLPPLRLPSLAQHVVPGLSPLEASGWAEADAPPR